MTVVFRRDDRPKVWARVTPQQIDAVERWCREAGCTRSQFVRRAVTQLLRKSPRRQERFEPEDERFT